MQIIQARIDSEEQERQKVEDWCSKVGEEIMTIGEWARGVDSLRAQEQEERDKMWRQHENLNLTVSELSKAIETLI